MASAPGIGRGGLKRPQLGERDARNQGSCCSFHGCAARCGVGCWIAGRRSRSQHPSPVEYPDDSEMRVSHETIYRSLFVQARGGLRKELTTCLRSGRTRRRPHKRTQLSRSGRLKDMVLISERPAEAADRAVPGHWEGDLIIGKGSHSAIGTLVERSSRYVMLLRPMVVPPRTCASRSHARSPSSPRSFAARSPGTRARRWPSTYASASTSKIDATSAIRTVPGSEEATRTPTVY